ncbi:MAG: hypothetical protein R3F42_09885 [Pseudomonadota bacterium]
MNAIFRLRAVLIAFLAALFSSSSWAVALDLSTFITENYVTLDGASNWVVSGPDNSLVTQTLNSDPSIFRSGGLIDVTNNLITGEFTISGTDDDIIGFTFGYQNRGQMYLFGWKQLAQGNLLNGMYLSLIDTGNPLVDPNWSYLQIVDTVNFSNCCSYSCGRHSRWPSVV